MPVRKRDEVFPNCAAVDVGASRHWVAVAEERDAKPVRSFGPMTADLHALADWLLGCGIDTVVLESTGVYWIPLFEILEQRRLRVFLVDARQIKYVPGRKSDVQDCQWLQRVMAWGLLRPAFRPPDAICVVRAIVRQQQILVAEQSHWVQRMQKVLLEMNIQLTEVLSDVVGATGQAIIRAIVAGERDPCALASHRRGGVKASAEQIAAALTGNWRDEHLFVLRQALAMYDHLAGQCSECEGKLQELLSQRATKPVDLGRPPRSGSKARAQFDLRQMLAGWAGVDLTRIPGIAATTALTILAEIGPDLSRFANVKHFCSWLTLSPATKISGGKVLSARSKRSANRVRQALKMAAQSLARSQSALGAFYRRLCTRMDAPRANTAAAHKLARTVYFMLTRGEAFVEQGQQEYEDKQRQRSIAALKRRATGLGFTLQPAASSA